MYKQERDKIFEKLGWTIECESPYEIYHEESNSLATGMAAQIVEEELIKNWKEYLDENEE